MVRWGLLVLLIACDRTAQAPAGSGSGSGSQAPTHDLPHLAEQGGLAYEIVDDATGERMPGKLTVIGVKGSKDPRYSKGDIGHEEDTSMSAFNRIYSLAGVGVVGTAV